MLPLWVYCAIRWWQSRGLSFQSRLIYLKGQNNRAESPLWALAEKPTLSVFQARFMNGLLPHHPHNAYPACPVIRLNLKGGPFWCSCLIAPGGKPACHRPSIPHISDGAHSVGSRCRQSRHGHCSDVAFYLGWHSQRPAICELLFFFFF